MHSVSSIRLRPVRIALLATGLAAAFLHACDGDRSGRTEDAGTSTAAAPSDGQRLFVENCAACHQRDRDATGPALQGVVARWEGDTARLRAFIRNSQAAADGGDARAQALRATWSAAMPPYTELSDKDIDAVLGYVEAR